MGKSAFPGKPSVFSELIFFIHKQNKLRMPRTSALFLANTHSMAHGVENAVIGHD